MFYMKKVDRNLKFKKKLENSVTLIYDEITQNLCLVKLILTNTGSVQFDGYEENNKKCQELINRSISQLRQIAESINEIKNDIQSK